MDMFILAEMAGKWDFSGVWCLASVFFLFIALVAYACGPINGTCFCLGCFVITLFVTGDVGDAGSGSNMTPNSTYIANKSQTKIIERYKCDINDPGCVFSTPLSRGFGEDTWFLPAEERIVVDGIYRLKSTGKLATVDDYYIYNKTFDPLNVPVEAGGSGVPQWLYHPASPFWIFGIGGLPALLGGMFIASKLF